MNFFNNVVDIQKILEEFLTISSSSFHYLLGMHYTAIFTTTFFKMSQWFLSWYTKYSHSTDSKKSTSQYHSKEIKILKSKSYRTDNRHNSRHFKQNKRLCIYWGIFLEIYLKWEIFLHCPVHLQIWNGLMF